MTRPTAKAEAVLALLRADLASLSARVDRFSPRDFGAGQVEWLRRQWERILSEQGDTRRSARERAKDSPRLLRRARLLACDARREEAEPCPECESGISTPVRGEWVCGECGHVGLERVVLVEPKLEGS